MIDVLKNGSAMLVDELSFLQLKTHLPCPSSNTCHCTVTAADNVTKEHVEWKGAEEW